jgi:twitching motility protein PilT
MFRKQDMDYILDHMLRFRDRISDLNMTVGKPLQVESDGSSCPRTSIPRWGT